MTAESERSPDEQTHFANRADEPFGVLEIMILLAKRKSLIVGLPFFAAILAIVYSLLATEIYTSNARVLIPTQGQTSAAAVLGQLGGLAGIAAPGVIRNAGETYIALLRSRTVADKLADRFNLVDKYKAKLLSDVRGKLDSVTKFAFGKDGTITIEVEDENPKFAAELADAYIEELIRLTNSLAVTEAGQRRLFFERQLQQAKDGLIKAEIAARSALERGGVAMVDEQGKSMIQTIATLRAQIVSREVQISAMKSYANEQNPDLLRTRQELSALRQQLSKLEGGMPMAATSGSGRGTTQGLKSLDLLREVKFNEVLFELLVKQFEIAKIDEAKEAVVVQILDKAVVPDRRSRPKRAIIVLVATFAAGLFAVFLAFLVEAIDRMRKDPQRGGQLLQLYKHLGLHK